jgi:ABC-type polysaccharide/polyol phosphate export permease
MEVIFVCGLALLTTAANVYIRDTRYLVESINTILFWMVPIFYSFSAVPQQFRGIYELNPIAALALALRNILMSGTPPRTILMLKLAGSSLFMLGLGLVAFRKMKQGFYDYL